MSYSMSHCKTCNLSKEYFMSATHKLDMWKPCTNIKKSCRHPDLTKALNHCYKSKLCEILCHSVVSYTMQSGIGTDDSTFASNLDLISELVQEWQDWSSSVCLMLGIDTDLQTRRETWCMHLKREVRVC